MTSESLEPDGLEMLTPEAAWTDLVEKDDRNSPADSPEMCLITFDELADYMAHSLTARPPAQGVGVGKLKAADLAWWTVRRVANGDATKPCYEIPDEDRTALIEGILELEQKAEARWRVQDRLHAELQEANTNYENMAICRDIANDRALAAEAALRRRLLFCQPDEDPVKYAAEVEVIAAAGRIFDLFGGPKWRERADISSVYESADWEAALSYARAALSSAQALATPSSEGEGTAYTEADYDRHGGREAVQEVREAWARKRAAAEGDLEVGAGHELCATPSQVSPAIGGDYNSLPPTRGQGQGRGGPTGCPSPRLPATA